MTDGDRAESLPLLTAVSSSARQLFILLRCIHFGSKTLVHISEEGLRFSVEESHVMEGLAFLDKSLFTSYIYNPPRQLPQGSEAISQPFEVSLPAFLETLQIFNAADNTSSGSRPWSHDPFAPQASFNNAGMSAFDNRILGMPGLCRLQYAGPGSAFTITLEEPNLTTTCNLTTYEPDFPATLAGYDGGDTSIPFQRDALSLKIIMRSSLLYDAIMELSSTSADCITLTATSPTKSNSLALFSLSATGSHGTATVTFSTSMTKSVSHRHPNTTDILETFQVAGRKVTNTYKFTMVKAAAKAMQVATKVSIRGDEQGVLSLQFMIEVDVGKVSFVDFRFVPCLGENQDKEGQDDGYSEEEEEEEEEEDDDDDDDDDENSEEGNANGENLE